MNPGGTLTRDEDPQSVLVSAVCAAVFQMYDQEKMVLEELSRYTGARLQPLSRDLY